LVAPGFGKRGIEGKIAALNMHEKIMFHFLGICLGMQCAVIEFGRNVLGFTDAHSTEMYPETPYPVIYLMEEQRNITKKGGTMRLGAYPCTVKEGTLAYQAYGHTAISERHRHRYEFNNKYLADYEKQGMKAYWYKPRKQLG
jgi:CTP synthase